MRLRNMTSRSGRCRAPPALMRRFNVLWWLAHPIFELAFTRHQRQAVVIRLARRRVPR